jgi:hypothetical protein
MLSKLDNSFWELSQHQWWLSPGTSMVSTARNTSDVQVTAVAIIAGYCVSSEAALTCDLRMLFCCHDVDGHWQWDDWFHTKILYFTRIH